MRGNSFFFASGGGDNWIELTTDQSTPTTFSITTALTSSQTINFEWGDGADTDVVGLGGGTTILTQHVYSAGDTYAIKITGDIEDIDLIRCSDANFTAYNGNSLANVGTNAVDNAYNLDFASATNLVTVQSVAANLSSITGTGTGIITLDLSESVRKLKNSAALTNLASVTTLTTVNLGASGVHEAVSLNGCTSLTTVTASNLANCTSAGAWNFDGCTSLSTLTMPTGNNTYTLIRLNSCNSLTSFDIGTGTNSCADFEIKNNTGITTVSSTGTATTPSYDLFNCDAVVVADMANFTGITTFLAVRSSSSFTTWSNLNGTINVILATSNTAFTSMSFGTTDFATMTSCNISSNALNAATINEMLVLIDGDGNTGGTFTSNGGTNAAPDGSSGGFDGTTAKSNLIANSWTVTTT